MSALNSFIIPLKGLKDGIHEFDFEVADWFFEEFPESPIKKGTFDVKLFFDKRPDMLVLTFDFKGRVHTDCDRCLAAIKLPVQGNQQLLFKYAGQEGEEGEVIYITRHTSLLNVARFLYEYICLALPLIKAYNCEEDPEQHCNEEMLNILDNKTGALPSKNESESVWDELKKLKK